MNFLEVELVVVMKLMVLVANNRQDRQVSQRLLPIATGIHRVVCLIQKKRIKCECRIITYKKRIFVCKPCNVFGTFLIHADHLNNIFSFYKLFVLMKSRYRHNNVLKGSI